MKHDAHTIYTCPMHPEIQKESPGMCPECGMALVVDKERKKVEVHVQHAGSKEESRHAGHSTQMFLRKFWVSFALTIPVVLYSDLPTRFFGWTAPAFPGSEYLPITLSTVVFFYGGWIFIRGAYREIVGGLPGMMTLIGIAISAAYVYSVFQTLLGREETLFWELTTLITVMLLGHWMEMKSVQGAQSALKALSKLLPDKAELVLKNEKTKVVPLSELRVDNVVLVRPGAKIPADGVVVEGVSEVNEAMVTGESKPTTKSKGSEVIAGTLNGDGSLKVRVMKIGEHTFLAGVMRLVEEAQASKSKIQILSDKAALYLTAIAVIGGMSAFWYWFLAGAGAVFALERFVAVLVIACPHALGLAVPLVASISTTMAATNGFLVRQRLALESARKIDVVLFDKTGTLTKGEYGIQDIVVSPEFSAGNLPLAELALPNPKFSTKALQLLQLAASADNRSEHFAARAIVREAEDHQLSILPISDFERIPGKGVSAKVRGDQVRVGGEAILKVTNAKVPNELRGAIESSAARGETVIYVTSGKALAGIISLADVIREESRGAIAELQAMGVTAAMLTGDSEEVARWVAKELGIGEYFARVLPEEKSERVKELQSRGLKVAMVGDGINDAPALTQADLGIAIGAGTNVAIESAGIILVKNDPRDIVKIIKLSRMTYSKMVQNLFWASGYNIVALPLAAGVLAAQGVILQPAVGAVFMSLSTVIVAINALFLKRKKL